MNDEVNVIYNNDNVLVYFVEQDYCFTFENYDILQDIGYIGEYICCCTERYRFDEEMCEYYDRVYRITNKEATYIEQIWAVTDYGVDTELYKRVESVKKDLRNYLKEYKKAVLQEKDEEYKECVEDEIEEFPFGKIDDFEKDECDIFNLFKLG